MQSRTYREYVLYESGRFLCVFVYGTRRRRLTEDEVRYKQILDV